MTGTCPRWLRLLVVATAGTVVLGACAPTASTTTSTPKAGGTLTVASWQEQDSLLACNITAAASHACAYINPAMEGLLTVKANQDPLPTNPKLSDYWVPELATEVPLHCRDRLLVGRRPGLAVGRIPKLDQIVRSGRS